MNTKEHNGWTNYETWLINLWLDNEQGSQEIVNEWAERVLKIAGRGRELDGDTISEATTDLESTIKEYHEELISEAKIPTQGFICDMLSAAMSEVNWREIAGHYIDAAVEDYNQSRKENA